MIFLVISAFTEQHERDNEMNKDTKEKRHAEYKKVAGALCPPFHTAQKMVEEAEGDAEYLHLNMSTDSALKELDTFLTWISNKRPEDVPVDARVSLLGTLVEDMGSVGAGIASLYSTVPQFKNLFNPTDDEVSEYWAIIKMLMLRVTSTCSILYQIRLEQETELNARLGELGAQRRRMWRTVYEGTDPLMVAYVKYHAELLKHYRDGKIDGDALQQLVDVSGFDKERVLNILQDCGISIKDSSAGKKRDDVDAELMIRMRAAGIVRDGDEEATDALVALFNDATDEEKEVLIGVMDVLTDMTDDEAQTAFEEIVEKESPDISD